MTAVTDEWRQRIFQTWGKEKIARLTWHKTGRVYARRRQGVCLSLQNLCIRMSHHPVGLPLPFVFQSSDEMRPSWVAFSSIALWAPSPKSVTQQDLSCIFFPPALLSRTDSTGLFLHETLCPGASLLLLWAKNANNFFPGFMKNNICFHSKTILIPSHKLSLGFALAGLWVFAQHISFLNQ